VWVRGWGWPEGRAASGETAEIFCRSKINLNINTPPERWRLRSLARIFFKRSVGKIVPDLARVPDNFKTWLHTSIPQIKARPFEILAQNAFLISGYADDMDNYYEDGKEIVYYRTIPELIEKVRYYLPRDEEREKIAQAGYKRTIREHSYEKRFRDMFRVMKLDYK
jgi:spore maturation protein CgeB